MKTAKGIYLLYCAGRSRRFKTSDFYVLREDIYCVLIPSPNKVNNSCGYHFNPMWIRKSGDRLAARLTGGSLCGTLLLATPTRQVHYFTRCPEGIAPLRFSLLHCLFKLLRSSNLNRTSSIKLCFAVN